MVHTPSGAPGQLGHLGWHSFFEDQLAASDAGLLRLRVDAIHRGRLTGLDGAKQLEIDLPPRTDTAEFAVGDWVLADPLTMLLQRRLERRTLLQRAGEGRR
ncbi:MAG: GTPase RsgA, partial [Devosia sp.]